MEEKYKELGEEVNVVMINIEGEDIDRTAGEFAKEHKLTLPHFAVDSMDDVEAYGVQFIPHHTVISVRIRSLSFCAPTAGADTLCARLAQPDGVVLASPAEGDAFADDKAKL